MQYILIYFLQVMPPNNIYTIDEAMLGLTRTECLKEAEEFNALPKEQEEFLFATCTPLVKHLPANWDEKVSPVQ